MNFFEDIIGDILFSRIICPLLQQFGAVIRWVFFLGTRKHGVILKNRNLNIFVALAVIFGVVVLCI